jgi:CheY-like chemotaxis protein
MPDKKRILLIDDDVDFLTVNRLALEAAGYEVLSSETARRGVEMAREESPDLILMDLMMEELHSGFAALGELKHHSETRNIPVIMITAVTTATGFRIDEQGEVPDWLKAAEFINKPVDPKTLVARVGERLAPS